MKHSILLRPDHIGERFSFFFLFLFYVFIFFFGKRRKCLKFCKSVDSKGTYTLSTWDVKRLAYLAR